MTNGVRTVLVMPGQGSQRLGMITDAPESDDLLRLLDAAEALSGLDLRRIEAFGSTEELADTRVAQPLLFLSGWAWAQALLESGLEPDAAAGHSLGELTALSVAGVFSVEAGLELVVERSQLMAAAAAAAPGGMAAIIGLDRATVESALSEVDGVWVANDNSATQVVITGRPHALEAAAALLQEAGARRIVPLDVAGAFHSPLMEPARAAFAALLAETAFSASSFPVLQNTDPRPTTDPVLIRERLMSQMTEPVRWTETMLALQADGPCTFVEAGPGTVLTGLARRTEGITALAVETSGIEAVMAEVS